MTKRAFPTLAHMKKLAAVAKEFGIRVEIEVDGMLVRFAPDQSLDDLEKPQTLKQWKSPRDRARDLLEPLGKPRKRRPPQGYL